ncbi:hypothetical protein DL93DRAFT_2095554 [Clavulina sp. PMI_390]|nr:hypothetical protein DL93DRAFT_2095554 [Clavulina sp. PMI_390]
MTHPRRRHPLYYSILQSKLLIQKMIIGMDQPIGRNGRTWWQRVRSDRKASSAQRAYAHTISKIRRSLGSPRYAGSLATMPAGPYHVDLQRSSVPTACAHNRKDTDLAPRKIGVILREGFAVSRQVEIQVSLTINQVQPLPRLSVNRGRNDFDSDQRFAWKDLLSAMPARSSLIHVVMGRPYIWPHITLAGHPGAQVPPGSQSQSLHQSDVLAIPSPTGNAVGVNGETTEGRGEGMIARHIPDGRLHASQAAKSDKKTSIGVRFLLRKHTFLPKKGLWLGLALLVPSQAKSIASEWASCTANRKRRLLKSEDSLGLATSLRGEHIDDSSKLLIMRGPLTEIRLRALSPTGGLSSIKFIQITSS